MQRNHYPIKIVFVRGNIFINNKKPKPILEIGACYIENQIKKIDEIIEGEFIIDDNTITSEDTCYCASGSVYAYETGGGIYSRYNLIKDYDTAIDNIITLSKLNVEHTDKQLINRLLFANIYSSMEAFLQDICSYYMFKKPKYKEAYLQNHERLKTEKLLLSQIYDKYNQINYKIRNAIDNTVYHRLSEEIQPLFEGTFGIEFPDYTFINEKLEIRHDIVHRNGKSKNGVIIHHITNKDIYELIEHVDTFVHKLFDEFEKLKEEE